jgi:hypothetical protein
LLAQVILLTACAVYISAALLWLYLRGMGGSRDRLDEAILVGLVVALGGFLALLVFGGPWPCTRWSCH